MTIGAPSRLDASALIELADRASVLSPGQWSVALLQRAYPEATRETLLALPVGARDIFRGEYVSLGYNVGRVPARLLVGPLPRPNTAFYVTLLRQPDGTWKLTN